MFLWEPSEKHILQFILILIPHTSSDWSTDAAEDQPRCQICSDGAVLPTWCEQGEQWTTHGHMSCMYALVVRLKLEDISTYLL